MRADTGQKMKAKVKSQKAKVRWASPAFIFAFCLLTFAFCLGAFNGSTTTTTLYENGGSGVEQGVRLQECNGRPQTGKDLGQYRVGRSHAKRQADGRRG